MKAAKYVVWTGLVVMTVGIIWTVTAGDIRLEGAALWSMPWGRLTLLDLYLGFVLFSGWIVFREQSILRSMAWILALMILGNWMAMIYVLVAFARAQGSWTRFWMGRRINHE